MRTRLEINLGEFWKRFNDVQLMYNSVMGGANPHIPGGKTRLADAIWKMESDIAALKKLLWGRDGIPEREKNI